MRVVRLDCTWIDPNLQVEHLATAGRSEAGFGRRLLGAQASGGGGRPRAAGRRVPTQLDGVGTAVDWYFVLYSCLVI